VRKLKIANSIRSEADLKSALQAIHKCELAAIDFRERIRTLESENAALRSELGNVKANVVGLVRKKK